MPRVLAGVGEMLQARSRRRLYWVHAIWVTILYLASIVLFPPESSLDEFVNYKTHYFADTLLKGISHLVASGEKEDATDEVKLVPD